jgi:predicted Zn-dependent peptidase
MFFITLLPKKTSAQALAVIDREIADLAAGKVTDQELKRAIAMHRFSVFDELASNYAKAQFLGFYETVAGDFKRGVQIVDELASTQREGIMKAAKSVFRRSNRSVVVGTPVKGARS